MKNGGKRSETIQTNFTINDYLRRLSKWYLLLFILLPLLFIFLIFLNFRTIYSVTNENIRNKAEATLLQYAVELNDFINPGIKIMESMSYNVEDMFRTNAGNAEIENYLKRETETMEATTDIETNGIYGFVKGEYLDGYGWEPDPDFDPVKRPWYKGALKKDGEPAYIEPYIDSKTGDRVMTISRVLSDGESVLCIDIKMNQIQAITESLISEGDNTSEVIVLDDDGDVVSHSDPAEVGKNYLDASVEPDATIARKVLTEKEEFFTVKYKNSNHIVYSMELGGGWYMLSVTSERKMFAKLFHTFANSLAVGLLGTIIILHVLFIITRKRVEAEDYIIDLKSVSSIYLCMYKVNLKDDSFMEISCRSDRIAAMVGDKRNEACKVMKNCVTFRSDERTREDILEFTDLTTVAERLKEQETITCEFMNNEKSWSRARFIVAERDDNDMPVSVIFMVEVIDEEKKARDRLIYLSETDRMTGVNNRGSGENRVRKQLVDGDGGMFMLLDVDEFKSINDSFGHDVGDRVLIAIADAMKKAFRNNDILMRLGGDEFAAFAPLVYNRDGGEIIVDRFLKQVDRIWINEMGDRKVEISVGVAFYQPDDQFTFDELYKRADKCTYESKKKDGSTVTFYEA